MSESDDLTALRCRVRELEDAVLYLSNTLMMNGVISETEAMPARRMYDKVSRQEREAP